MKPRILNTARISFTLASAIAALLTAQSAIAAPYSWNGATNGTWNTGSNWSGTTVPLIADDLTILGPLNAAGALTLDFDADNSANSLNFTNTAATSVTNTTSGADKTLTLGGSSGITTGTGAVQIGSTTANQAVNITLAAAQTWKVGAGGMTVTNLIGGLGTGITKTGTGNLSLNSGIANGFTGGLNANGGTLTLDYNNLPTPTNLVDSANALQVNNGALTITGKATGTTAQTFAGTTFGVGVNTVNISRNGASGSATLNLGALTVNTGAVTTFSPATTWTSSTNTPEKAFISAGGSVPSLPAVGPTAYVNSGLFTRVAGGAAGVLRPAAVNSNGQFVLKTLGVLADSIGDDPTVYYQLTTGATTLITLSNTGASVYGLLLNSNTTVGTLDIVTPDNGTLTLNSLIQASAFKNVNINAGAGTSNLVIGAEKNLVIAMDNTKAVTFNAIIANNGSVGGTGGTASAVTIAGTAPTGTTPGTVTFAGANTYSGATTVNLATLLITHNDALGTTDGATTINGGNGATAVTLSLSSAASDLVVAEPLNFNGNAVGRAQLVNNSVQNHTLSGPINVSSDTNVAQFSSSGTGSITLSGDITGTFTNGASLFLRGGSTSDTNQVTGSLNLTSNLSKTDGGTWLVGASGKTYSWTNTGLFVGTLKMGAASVLPAATSISMGNTTGASTPTLDLNGFNQTIGGINYGGEAAVPTPATGTRTITSATPATLTVNNATNSTTTGTNVSTNNIVLTGALALTKQGAGKLELNGVNTNSGDTIVSAGILSLTNADSALDANTGNDASTVSIAAAAGAILDLAYTGTDEVNALFIGGVQKAAGVWGSTTSGAANTDAKFTGSGTLTVATGTVSNNYASWAAIQTPPVIEGANGDDDKDGVTNLVEYALADGQERGTLTGTSLSFTKRGAPYGGDLTYEIETSDNLGISDPWSTATPTVNSATTISYTLLNPGDNFGRLKVTKVP